MNIVNISKLRKIFAYPSSSPCCLLCESACKDRRIGHSFLLPCCLENSWPETIQGKGNSMKIAVSAILPIFSLQKIGSRFRIQPLSFIDCMHTFKSLLTPGSHLHFSWQHFEKAFVFAFFLGLREYLPHA